MKNISLSKLIVLTFTVSLITGLIGGALTNEYLISYLFGHLTEKQQEELPIVKKVIEEKIYVEESSILSAVETARDSVVLLSDVQNPGDTELKPLNSDLFYTGVSSQKTFSQNAVIGGTGTILTTDGIIVTCASLVQNSNVWFVTFSDGEVLKANVVYRDKLDDLALLQIENSDSKLFKTLKYNEEPLKIGQKVLAFGALDKLKSGIISSLPVNEDLEKRIHLRKFPSEFITVDFEINSNLSCSPLLNLGGELVGMNLDFDTIEQGTSYSIPSKTLNEVFQTFRQL